MMNSKWVHADRVMMDTLYPIFRRHWRPSEEPIAILGTTTHWQKLMILVRIERPGDDVEAIKKNPCVGLGWDNMRITLSPSFQVEHAQMLIKYYESKLVFVEDSKTEEEKAEGAARAMLLHRLKDHDNNFGEMYKDMMKDLPKHLQIKDDAAKEGEQVADGAAADAGPSTSAAALAAMKTDQGQQPQEAPAPGQLKIDEETKMKILQEYREGAQKRKAVKELEPEEDEDEPKLDMFGLPVEYMDTDESDSSSDDDDDEDYY